MISKKFKEEYAKLNKKQREAVDKIEGPVMVIAGPGTGKTTVLTLRIANILRLTDTPPSGILALTFTDAGARAMRKKLRDIMGNSALDVPIHTFHGFAASVMAEFEDYFPHLSRSKQITEVEAEALVRDILKSKKYKKLRPLGDPDFYVAKIIKAISDSKQEAHTPEMLRSFASEEISNIKNNPDSVSSRGKSKGQIKSEALRKIEKCEKTAILADVYEEYEKRKREENKMDYDDLIFELLKALRENEFLLRILQERFLYLLVDEHQDTNDAQNLIVRVIADFFDSPNLFVVGDEKQAIYRFQGASVENFLSLQKKWAGMKTIFLDENYRSHQHILDASFKMIEKNYEAGEHKKLRIKLKARKKDKKFLDLVSAPNAETEELHLVKEIKNILKKDRHSSIAVITRKNNGAAKIFSLLQENDIPASAERGADIFSHPVGVLFFTLLEFFSDQSDTEALSKTLAAGLWGLDFERQIKLIKSVRSGNLAEVGKTVPTISKIQKEMGRMAPMEFLFAAAGLSGFEKTVSRDPLSVEVWRNILKLAESLVQAEEIESAAALAQKILAYKKTAERKVVKIKTGEISAPVSVLTAHGSKGLEFDYVFLPYATEESWLSQNRGSYFILPKEREEGDNIRDERRLFYVAITRAKKHVVISFHQEDFSGKASSPLRFIEELDQNCISQTKLSKIEEAPRSKIKENKKSEQIKIEYAKRVILEDGLSVTALNHFLECPNKFFYKSILKLPEAPTASSEKGSAMHEAVANVWKSPIPKKISNILISSIKNYFKRSFLPLHEKEIVLEELTSDAPKVAATLINHFAQDGSVRVESWVEAPFETRIEKEKLEISLHGKLDALIEQEDKILVYDYKTREGMSKNAIKGETKSSGQSGNYFRQLVFYKILVDRNHKFKGKLVEPALVFIKPDRNGKCPTVSLPIEKEDVEKVESEISNLLESVWSGKFMSETCDDRDCEYCKLRKLL